MRVSPFDLVDVCRNLVCGRGVIGADPSCDTLPLAWALRLVPRVVSLMTPQSQVLGFSRRCPTVQQMTHPRPGEQGVALHTAQPQGAQPQPLLPPL